jgi:alpha-galactosidase
MKSRFIFLFALWTAMILPSANTKAQTDADAILTSPAPAAPRINGANIFGARPGSPFLYIIPAAGDRPMEFIAENLPNGLTLDAVTN